MLGRKSGIGILLAAWVACTEPAERPFPILVSVDGDSLVRENTMRMEIVVEGASNDAKSDGISTIWEQVAHRTLSFDPSGPDFWPYQFRLDSKDSTRPEYSLKATARDVRGAVVASAQAIRDLAEARSSELRVHFETSCYRRTPRCDDGFTCTGGECIDSATAMPMISDGGGAVPTDPGQTNSSVTANDDGEGIARAGDPCVAGARACSGYASRAPLACEDGAWRAEPLCEENQRCHTAKGDARGTCQRITTDCMNREPNVPYCDGETMRVCPDLVASIVRECADNERCTTNATGALCGCDTGFAKESGSDTCVKAAACGSSSSICDPLTECRADGSKLGCTECPTGYVGTGEEGCRPRLLRLMSDQVAFDPPFDPATPEYRLRVPLLVQRVTFNPELPRDAAITFNGIALESNGTWTTGVLSLDETKIDVTVTSTSGMSTAYTIVLQRDGAQEAYIKADSPDARDQFGFEVDVEGDTLLATAWFEDSGVIGVNGDENDDSMTDSGAAYVYVRDGSDWKRQAYLKPSDTSAGDYFGVRGDLDGDTIVIGAIHESIFDPGLTATRRGAAYTYERKGGVWSFVQRLEGSNGDGADLYGTGVALQGDTLAIGAAWQSSDADRSGAVYIYERVGGMWVERQMLKSSLPSASAAFGSMVALDGDVLIVGAPNDNRTTSLAGSAEIFVRRNGTWASQQFLQPSTLGTNANFGFAVSVRGDRIAVGAPRTSPYFAQAPTRPGEVYLFERDGDRWNQTAVLRAPLPNPTDCFGMDIVLANDLLLIGASGDSSGAQGLGGEASREDASLSGAAYLYAQMVDGWKPSTYIKPSNTGAGDAFGYTLAVDPASGTLVVSGNLEGSSAKGINGMGSRTSGGTGSGAVYVFR